jgi:hypothetical protein
MTALRQILADLGKHGARVVVRDGRPNLVKPVGLELPPDLLAATRNHKHELAFLAASIRSRQIAYAKRRTA